MSEQQRKRALSTMPSKTGEDRNGSYQKLSYPTRFALAYSPGVAAPCRNEKDPRNIINTPIREILLP